MVRTESVADRAATVRRARPSRAMGGAVAFLVILGGCTPTQVELVSPNFTNLDVRGVLVRALVLVAGEDADRAALSVAFLNTGDEPDTLAAVQVEPTVAPDGDARENPQAPTDQAVTVRPDLTLPPGELVEVGGPGDRRIVLPERAGGYRVGSFAQVTLRFTAAGPVTTRVQVADPANYLRPVAPDPSGATTAPSSR